MPESGFGEVTAQLNRLSTDCVSASAFFSIGADAGFRASTASSAMRISFDTAAGMTRPDASILASPFILLTPVHQFHIRRIAAGDPCENRRIGTTIEIRSC